MIDICSLMTDVECLDATSGDAYYQDAYARVAQAKAELKRIDAMLDAALKAKLADGGRVELEGGKYLCLGKVKKTRLLDGGVRFIVDTATKALLTTGDEGILAADPFKPGAVKKLMGEEVFDEVYEVTHEQEVDEKGGIKPKKEVKVIDPAFSGKE